ncbi:MAG: DUF4159 domain-containing protein [Bacteroidetes bacterium]|nr:DUF4159 domain-containing protein [Bacteroidota bacterium]
MRKTLILPVIFSLFTWTGWAQNTTIALLKYQGGGDWYANPSALPNLIRFCNKELNTNLNPEPVTMAIGSSELFNYPLAHLTGHGNIILSPEEVENLRLYLASGGFLHISDNYGLDPYIRREMKRVFPDKEFVELPFNHPIFHQKYSFPDGLPKIHEHDGGDPQGFGLFIEDRLVCFYDYECDLGDGWEDPGVHHDSETKRLEALQMGANLIQFVFSQ